MKIKSEINDGKEYTMVVSFDDRLLEMKYNYKKDEIDFNWLGDALGSINETNEARDIFVVKIKESINN